MTKLVAELLNELNLNVREIHSRKPQSYRTRVSDEFRKSTGLILVTSDVSARGVDYPDVTLVVQVIIHHSILFLQFYVPLTNVDLSLLLFRSVFQLINSSIFTDWVEPAEKEKKGKGS